MLSRCHFVNGTVPPYRDHQIVVRTNKALGYVHSVSRALSSMQIDIETCLPKGRVEPIPLLE